MLAPPVLRSRGSGDFLAFATAVAVFSQTYLELCQQSGVWQYPVCSEPLPFSVTPNKPAVACACGISHHLSFLLCPQELTIDSWLGKVLKEVDQVTD